MFQLRPANARGHADHGWLQTSHTFSFGDFYDPQQMGFRVLRVINEDRVQAGMGFGMHPHRDMEIITYVLSGALEHKDSMGHVSTLQAGEFQHMSAGSGIRHSEFNPSATEPVHLYQIWLLPKVKNVTPSYSQKFFAESERQGRLRIVAAPDGAEGALIIQLDARVYLASLAAGDVVKHELAPGRHAWLQTLRGQVQVNDLVIATSDGLAVSDETGLTIVGNDSAEIMLFDLP